MVKKGYTQDQVFAILLESNKDKKRRATWLSVTKTVHAHRLKEMENLALKVEMAVFRRKKCFDRDETLVYDGIPLPYEEFTAKL